MEGEKVKYSLKKNRNKPDEVMAIMDGFLLEDENFLGGFRVNTEAGTRWCIKMVNIIEKK